MLSGLFCAATQMVSSNIWVANTQPSSGGSRLLMIRVERFQREAAGPPPHTSQSPAVLTLETKVPRSGRPSSASVCGKNECISGFEFLKR